jgi:rare lipoprotein A
LKRRALVAAPLGLAPLALGTPLALMALGLPGCSLFRRPRPPPTPPPATHYVLGRPYQAGGVWRYPREALDLDETGLAAVIGSHGPLCTDGARYDPDWLIAAHPTVQLPCVAQVTDLLTGRQVQVRIDDRGPDSPSRALALSPRAASLLGGATADAAGQPVLWVRLQVLEEPSRMVLDAVGGGDTRLSLSAAPVGAVRAETLGPPGSAATASPVQALPAEAPSAPPVPQRLPETVTQVAVRAHALYIACGNFSRANYARLLASRVPGLGAVVDTDYAAPRDRAYRVRIGPLSAVAEADATLDRALRAGVVDARIVVD